MERYPYKQAAIFSREEDARCVQERISAVGFDNTLTFLLSPTSVAPDVDKQQLIPESDEIPGVMVRKAFYGGTGGALTGAAASMAAGAFKLALFASHPVLAGLAAIGYGTVIGATSGLLAGESLKEEVFVGVLEEALKQGQWAVIIHAPDKETARKIKVLLEHVHGADNLVRN
ncbi:MAG: hypothetical protein R3F02_10170 [Thiolinea sp.]